MVNTSLEKMFGKSNQRCIGSSMAQLAAPMVRGKKIMNFGPPDAPFQTSNSCLNDCTPPLSRYVSPMRPFSAARTIVNVYGRTLAVREQRNAQPTHVQPSVIPQRAVIAGADHACRRGDHHVRALTLVYSSDLVRLSFGRFVHRCGRLCAGEGLVHHRLLGRACRYHARDMNDFRHTKLERQPQHVARAIYVDCLHALAGLPCQAVLVPARVVNHDICTAHHFAHGCWIGDVT